MACKWSLAAFEGSLVASKSLLWDLKGLWRRWTVFDGLKGIWKPLKGLWQPVKGLWCPIKGLWQPVKGLWCPIKGLWWLVKCLCWPLKGLWQPVKGLWCPIKGLWWPLKGLWQPVKCLCRYIYVMWCVVQWNGDCSKDLVLWWLHAAWLYSDISRSSLCRAVQTRTQWDCRTRQRLHSVIDNETFKHTEAVSFQNS